jgi:hypothetical protein
LKMFNKLEARVLSEYKRSRAAPSTFCTLIKHYFSFIKHYLTHTIYHVVMEIGLGIKQSKHVYTTGWATPNSLPEIIIRSLKVGPSKVLGQL